MNIKKSFVLNARHFLLSGSVAVKLLHVFKSRLQLVQNAAAHVPKIH